MFAARTRILPLFALALWACDEPGGADGGIASFHVSRTPSTATAVPVVVDTALALAPQDLAAWRGPIAPPAFAMPPRALLSGAPEDPEPEPRPVTRCTGAGPWLEAPPVARDLTPLDLAAFDHFAMRVAVSGPWLAAGAEGDDNAPYDAGAVRLWRRDTAGWTDAGRLEAAATAANAHFGWDVDLHRDRLVVGAPGATVAGLAAAGAVEIFALPDPAGAWTPVERITAAVPTLGARFGESVRLGHQRLTVGAPGELDERGAAYVFTLADGACVALARLIAPEPAAGSEFGAAVAMSNDIVVVGAPEHHQGEGAAWVFVRRTAGYDAGAALIAPELTPSARFGGSVAISRDVILVGADSDSPGGLEAAGTVWVFEHRQGAWQARTRLSDLVPRAGAHFGASLRFDGAVAAVGAFSADGAVAGSGAVMLFAPVKGGWARLARLTDPLGGGDDHFGVGIGLSDGVVAVGAWGTDSVAVDGGRLIVFAYGGCEPAVGEVAPSERETEGTTQ